MHCPRFSPWPICWAKWWVGEQQSGLQEQTHVNPEGSRTALCQNPAQRGACCGAVLSGPCFPCPSIPTALRGAGRFGASGCGDCCQLLSSQAPQQQYPTHVHGQTVASAPQAAPSLRGNGPCVAGGAAHGTPHTTQSVKQERCKAAFPTATSVLLLCLHKESSRQVS